MAVTTATSSSRRANQFYEVTNIEGQDAILFYSNKDNILIPCDSNGTNPVYTGASITLSLFEGGQDVTSDWTIIVYSLSNVTGTFSSNIYTITSLFADIGTITFRASKEGYSNIYKEVKVYKVKAGSAGTNGNFCYIAFADDKEGTGFTTTFSEKEYYAILPSSTEVTSLDVTDFAGLWRPFYNYPEVPSYNNMCVLKTEDCAWNSLGMTNIALRPQSYHYKGTYNRIYFVLFDWFKDALGNTRANPHNVNSTKVGYYDLDYGYFSEFTTIAHQYNTSTDGHDYPSMIVTDDGYIIVAKEQLRSDGGHNSPIEIWKSSNPEDISSITNIVTLINSSYQGFSYPNIVKNSTQNYLHLIMRGNGASDHCHLRYIRSTDNGDTWEDIAGTGGANNEIASCYNIAGSGLDWYFYPNVLHGSRETGLCVLGTLNEGPNGTSPDGTLAASRNKFLVYLYSADGQTWGNAAYQHGTSGAFSKNISTSGYITPSELLTNFLVARCDTDAYVSFVVRDQAVSVEGIPYIMYSKANRWDTALTPDYSTKDNVATGTYISYFNTSSSAWVVVDISGIETEPDDVSPTKYSYYGFRPSLTVYNNGIIDIILHNVVDKTDFYKTKAVIDSGSEALGGGIFKILTTTSNNFGEGLMAGDYFAYTSSTYTSRIDASNTLTPLETRVEFKRSYDNGTTWTDVRPPLVMDGYATQNVIGASSSNILDSGVVAIWIGDPQIKSGGTAYSHSNLYLITEKIKPYIP